MRSVIMVLGVAALLGGCQTTRVAEMSYSEQQAFVQQMVELCGKQGFGPGTPQHVDCVNQEIRREALARESRAANGARFSAALGAGMQGVSQGYYNAAAQSQANMPRTYSCRRNPAPVGYSSVTCQ